MPDEQAFLPISVTGGAEVYTHPPDDGRPQPFNGYARLLTEEGGVFIQYRDQVRHPALACLRAFAGAVSTGLCAWLLFTQTALTLAYALPSLLLAATVIVAIVRRRFMVHHTVEIRSDALIVDGEDVFHQEDIGDNWPELHMKKDDPDVLVICGICGTRLIEYMTANRLDRYDRTPERLEMDLKIAFEQLWGRHEVTFDESS